MGLQIWLPLNGDLENKGLSDVSVTNNDASIGDNGKIGKCYNFETDKSYLLIPKESMTSTTEATVCFWLKILDWNASYATFFQAGKGANSWNNYIFGFLRYGTSSTCCFTISDGNSASNGDYSTPNLELNTWYHIGLVYKTGHCLIYINGDLYHDYSTSIVPNFGAITTISVGIANSKASYQSNCSMNDLRIYNEALSPMQIKLISQGLVAHYLLNNNGSGNNNLIPNQGEYTVNSPFVWSSNKIDGSKWIPNSAFEIKPSTTYTFSLCCDGNLQTQHLPKPEPSPEEKAFTVYLYLSNDGTTKAWQTGQYNIAMNLNSSNFSYRQIGQKHIWTFTTSSTQRYISIRVNNYSNGTDTLTLNYWNFKLEEGDKSTSWCPNPTDAIYTQLGYDNNIEYDVSGYCNNGTKYNITDYTSDTPRYSVATKFNGTNSYINIGKGGKIKDEITVNIWGYMDDWTKYNSRLISCTEGGGWNFEASSNKIHFAIGTGSTSNTYKYTSGYALSELSSGWHMFTGIYDGLVVKQYVDGVFNTNNNAYTTKTPIHYHSSNPILIGAEASSNQTPTANSYFNGNLSDVRIYATALSESDIASLYNNSAFVDSSGNVYATEYVES